MLANERVMTMADSSPAGETSARSTSPASGLDARQVTPNVGRPAARLCVATLSASEVDPDLEITTTASPGRARRRPPAAA